MTAKLVDVCAFFCRAAGDESQLSKARLTKLVYLADWRSVLKNGRQLTDIQWFFHHYGPNVEDIICTVRDDDLFVVISGKTICGNPKEMVKLTRPHIVVLDPVEQDTLEFVASKTAKLSYSELLRLVYATYPIATQVRYSALDLVALSRKYRANVLDSLSKL